MGKISVQSHASGSKHKANFKHAQELAKSNPSLLNYFAKTSNGTVFERKIVQNAPEVVEEISAPEGSRTVEEAKRPKTLLEYTRDGAVTSAEIIWSLNVVEHHLSFNSQKKSVKTMQTMFPDSGIASKMTLGPSKLAYFVYYGLAPYFKSKLLAKVKNAEFFVICFDEAMNPIVTRSQMDAWIRYWNDETGLVSIFLIFSGNPTLSAHPHSTYAKKN